jgi:hypothetical protein
MGELVKHGDGCPCTGCTGFLPGHSHSTKHGAYSSSLRLSPRTNELAAELREVVPLYSPADEVVIRLLALVLTRIELAAVALDRVDEASAGRELGAYAGTDAAQGLQRLREDLRRWVDTAARYATTLGLTPLSRARLGLDVALAKRTLGADLVERYGGDPS